MRVLGASWVLGCAAALAVAMAGCQAIFPFDDDLAAGMGGAGGTTTAGPGGGFGGMAGSGGAGGMSGSGGSGGGPTCGGTLCPDTGSECVMAVCEVDETCGTMDVADGTPTTAQIDGDCREIVCDGNGGTRSPDDDADIFDDGQSCTADTCAAGSPVHAPVALGTPCTDNGGLFCNAAGACVECNDGTQCTSQVCQAETCVDAPCNDAFENGNETDVDCGGADCGPCGDGLGCLLAGDCASGVCNGTTCEVATCTDGVKNGNSLETDIDCGGGACPGCADTLVCAIAPDCLSGVCTGGTCTPSDCTDGVLNGTETDVDCGGSCVGDCANGEICGVAADCTSNLCTGSLCAACTIDANCPAAEFCSAGVCVPDSVDGVACTAGTHCTSGSCADGVCCDTLCGGTCQACTMALKGAGADGVCGTIANNFDPQNECASGECKTSFCNGSGACGNQPNLTNCGTPLSCSGTTLTNQDTCNAVGVCIDNLTASCGAYACGATTCKTSCTVNADCSSGNYCTGGVCVPQKGNGIACTNVAGECSSGNCADGFCCNNACGGGCDTCSMAGSQGTCTNLVASSVGSPLCSPYVCSGLSGTCPSSCTVDANCINADYCSGSVCVVKLADGGSCSGNNQCANGNCVDGVCCENACAGSCQACSALKKGGGIDGNCGPIADTTDPDNECAVATCKTAACNGLGACGDSPLMTSCGTALSCTAGTQTNQDTCNGSGTCIDNATTLCGAYICGAMSCLTMCGADTDCSSAGDYCDGSFACVPKLIAGSACVMPNECVSNSCTANVCDP